MTVAELVKAIRAHRGKVEVPVLCPHDVMHVFAEKKDVIAMARAYQGGDGTLEAPWFVLGITNGVMRLDATYRAYTG